LYLAWGHLIRILSKISASLIKVKKSDVPSNNTSSRRMGPNFVIKWLTLYFVGEIPGSNLGPEIGYPG
jgi:hypothetical protein